MELYDVEIYVIHWPVNKEAPFKFSFPEGVQFYDRSKLNFASLREKVFAISPDFIFCSGWMDKEYVRVAHSFKKKIPVVVGLDNQWRGTLKQYIASILSKFTLQRVFTHCWVPGIRQKKYAEKLGFKDEHILCGSYTADVDNFEDWGKKFQQDKATKYPHIFIYTGRYYKFKGINDLWDAFCMWQNEHPVDWELWCIGTGTEEPRQHPKIKHFGFVQPENMVDFIEKGGVFILPSLFEPWGVVLHEFAAAGFPLITSDEVGASEAFLKKDENGYIFHAGEVNGLKECLQKMASLSDSQLIEMGNISRKKALTITPALWAQSVMSTLNK